MFLSTFIASMAGSPANCNWPWLLSLYVFVLSFLFAIGGMLRGISGKEFGWMVVGISVTVHFFNCVGLAVYFLLQ